MTYKILPYSYRQARKLGVNIKPSTNPKKKIDVFNKQGKKIASIGAKGYNDFPTFAKLEMQGKFPPGYASKRRRLYKIRHARTIDFKNKNAYFADKILW
jgi:hypothetical protein